MTRRFVIGLLVAGFIGGVAMWFLDAGARSFQLSLIEAREARLRVVMLADVAGRLGDDAETVSTMVDEFAAGSTLLPVIRIIEGRDLVASTAPADTGEAAAPRRLQREEKPLFDDAQALRAAVENNRGPNNPVKDVVMVVPLPDKGIVRIAAPIEVGDDVVGMVGADYVPSEKSAPPSLLWILFAMFLPPAVFVVVARAIGNHRVVAAVVAGLLVTATLLVLGHMGWLGVADAARGALNDLASTAQSLGGFAARTLGGAEAEAVVHPGNWDTDLVGTPRGQMRPDGSVDEAVFEADLLSARAPFRRGVAAITIIAIGLALFIGLGTAASTWDTLKHYREAYAYTTPALVAMLLLVFYPFFYGIYISFSNKNIYNENKPVYEIWVGLDNYVDILSDFDIADRAEDGAIDWKFNNFYWTLGFTIIWTVTNVAFGVTAGLILALILNTKGLRFRALYRVLLILPWAVPNYITALIWKGMFHKQFGVVNQVVQMFGGQPVSWFESPLTSFVTILATNGWLSFPFMMVIALGALQSIPADLYEAARVDGATRWQQFIGITLPSLKPALVPAVILSVVWTFNMFNIPYLVSQGEPASATEILITDAYKIAFEQYRYGYAAAYSTLIFVILLVYGVWQNCVTKATEGI
jgi:arabinogalactan oligomer/maltooligosaccharide transport system permease protein